MLTLSPDDRAVAADRSPLQQVLQGMRRYDCWRLQRYLSIGDPARGAVMRIGESTALRFDDVGYFNRVYDVGPDTMERIDELMAFYETPASRPSRSAGTARHGVELIARDGYDLADGAGVLRSRGFQPSKRMVRLGMELPDKRSLSSGDAKDAAAMAGYGAADGICIRALRSPDEFAAMLGLYLHGFGAPPENHAAAMVNMMQLHGRPELRTWCACEGADIVALGMLYEDFEVALLTAGVTQDAYRHRGLHRRLIQHRLEEAARGGKTSVVSWTDHGGRSHRNMNSLGMRDQRVDWVWRNDGRASE